MKLRKKITVFALLGALAIGSLFVFFYERSEPKTFMDEVKAVRAENKSSEVNIDEIVAKYVPAGTRKDAALKFCLVNELKIYPVHDKRHFDSKTYDESIVCSRNMMKEWYLFWTWWIWHDEVRIILDIKNDVVAHTHGFIFTHSL